MMYNLIYPEERSVDEAKILGWYLDAFANNECEEALYDTVDSMAYALEDAGLITLSKF